FAAWVSAALLAVVPRFASAGEVFATVERTVAPGERAIVRVRSDGPGPVLLVTFRVEDATALVDSGVDLTRGESLHVRLGGAIRDALAAGGPRAPQPFAQGESEAAPGAPPPIPARLTFIGT